jgi:hypothetical protein
MMRLLHLFLVVQLSSVFISTAEAALLYTAAMRSVEDLPMTAALSPVDPFADFEEGFAFLSSEPNEQGRLLSRASQRSSLRPDALQVFSSVAGDLTTGRSILEVTFTLTEPSAYSLSGIIGLAGQDGFVCISLVDLAHHETPLIEAFLFGPLPVAITRPISYSGILPAGNYTLDAIVYAGGTGQVSSGRLEAIFSIPEPQLGLTLALVSALWLVRRQRITIR